MLARLFPMHPAMMAAAGAAVLWGMMYGTYRLGHYHADTDARLRAAETRAQATIDRTNQEDKARNETEDCLARALSTGVRCPD